MQLVTVSTRLGKKVSLIIGLGVASMSYVHQTTNKKTGNIPTLYVGNSRQQSMDTCTVCPLLHAGCYSQHGTPAMGHASNIASRKRGSDKTLKTAIRLRHKLARFVRISAIGDAGSVNRRTLERHFKTIRAAGLGILGYTHHWYLQHATWLKRWLLASCDNWQDVLDATSQGWRTALHVSENDPMVQDGRIKGLRDGLKYAVCPAQLAPSGVKQCNTCGLCDASRSSSQFVVLFIEHGQSKKKIAH